MKNIDIKYSEAVALVEKMKRGEAVFALQYYEADDVFRLNLLQRKVRGTLTGYKKDFGKEYYHRSGNQFVVYWDVELGEWRTFRIEHLVTE